MRISVQAVGLVFLMVLAPLSGCFGENEIESLSDASLVVPEADSLEAGIWQTITLVASDDIAVFVPYFIQDPGSLRAQNGTVLDLKSGETVSMNILFPPRNEEIMFFIGEFGRLNWPIRDADESWSSWLEDRNSGSAVQAVDNQDIGGEWPWLLTGNETGGDVIPLIMQTSRPFRADLTEETVSVRAMVGSTAGTSMTGLTSLWTTRLAHLVGQTVQLAIWTDGLETPTHRMNMPSRTLKES